MASSREIKNDGEGQRPGPSDADGKAIVASAAVTRLIQRSRALEGTAAHMRATGARPDVLLMSWAGQDLVAAYCEGLFRDDLDVISLPREAETLIDLYRSRRRPGGSVGGGGGGDSASSASQNQSFGATDGNQDDLPSANAAGPSRGDGEPDAQDLRWLAAVSAERIERMLLECAASAGDGNVPDLESLGRRVVAGLWAVLSEADAHFLTPELARIKFAMLPGIEPWLGQAEDFLRASWVCGRMAERIDEDWNWITIKDAAEALGVPIWVITRAAGKPGGIEIARQIGRQRLLRRKSFDEFAPRYVKRAKTTARQKKERQAPLMRYRCINCTAEYASRLGHCQSCGPDYALVPVPPKQQ